MFRYLLAALALSAVTGHANAACPPRSHDIVALRSLKANQFALPNAKARQHLAVDLVDCLGDPDPALRDGIAFEALSTWMHGDKLDTATLRTLHARLSPLLIAEDPQGFRRPFAALVLSEVARTDHVKPWMGTLERARLVEDAAAYLAGVRDYRGFVDGEGWRHGVAHGADLVLQLALNPGLDATQRDALRDAVASQVVPAGEHAYVHGESLRLARPVVILAQHDTHDAAEWQAWLEKIASPAPYADWNSVFNSQAGLAKRHDTVAFLTALYLLVQEQDDVAAKQRLLPGLKAAVRTVP